MEELKLSLNTLTRDSRCGQDHKGGFRVYEFALLRGVSYREGESISFVLSKNALRCLTEVMPGPALNRLFKGVAAL